MLFDHRGTVHISAGRRAAHGNRASVSDGLLGLFDQFGDESQAVFEGAPVLVGALVGGRHELRNQIAVCCVDVDDVEARALRAFGGRRVPAAQVADIPFVHHPALHGIVAPSRPAPWAERFLPRVEVRRESTAVPELRARQRAVSMNFVDHQCLRAHILFVPQCGRRVGIVVGARVDRAVFGADDPPAALRLDFAHGGERLRSAVPHPGAMRDLIEAIGGRYGADLDRLEENVIPRIARHRCLRAICAPGVEPWVEGSLRRLEVADDGQESESLPVADSASRRSMADTSAGSSGSVSDSKRATTFPFRSTRYFWKFHSMGPPIGLGSDVR